ncbi:MAG: hypothetical protein WDZ72_12740 [Cyclobacteriaceae bacterium]
MEKKPNKKKALAANVANLFLLIIIKNKALNHNARSGDIREKSGAI